MFRRGLISPPNASRPSLMRCAGVPLQAQDGSGETPIVVAQRYGNVQAARLLSDALHFPQLHPDHHCGAHAQALSMRLQTSVRRRAQQPHLV